MSTPPQLIGTRLGAYDIQALLGSGGMANVYCGFDTNLHRAVAIKVLSPEAGMQPGFVDRFRQEARLIANLRHPNIVQVYDFGEHDSFTYMVQELLAGPTLAAWMSDLAARSLRPTPDEIGTIIAQLAGALDAAHAAGIIHRDVKPGNALWNDQGRLVLTDFGIAKQLLSATNQTQFGTIFGTPSYLSPEQAQTLPLTPASDVYSLGVVLYELLAGDVPFRGATPMQVAMDHIQTPPPPLPRPDLSPAVAAVVQRALAKNPAARFASAGELALALADAWAVVPAPPRIPSNTDIHNQATQHWQPPVPATAVPTPPLSSAPRIDDPLAVGARLSAVQHSRQSQSSPPLTRSRSLLPLLGALLAIVVLAGVVLAARGGTRSAPVASSATSVPASAGAAGAALPTSASAQLSTPSNATPSIPNDPFVELRTALEAGRADGRVGAHGDALLAALSSGQQALAAGDTTTAVQNFTAMQQVLLAGTHDGTITADFMVETMKRVQSLATSRGLILPLSIQFD